MKTDVIINGSNESGKDLFIEYFAEVAKMPVLNISTVDPAKKLCGLYGKTDKTEQNRLDLYTKNCELWESEIPLKYVSQGAEKMPDGSTCFIHCREPENISRLEKHFEGLGHRVLTLLVESGRTEPANNPADMGVGMFAYQHKIQNNGTLDELRKKAKEFCESLEVGQ